MEVRPVGKDSAGKSQGEDPKPGSLELYICPTGNVPVIAVAARPSQVSGHGSFGYSMPSF